MLCIACGFDLRKGVKIAGVGENEDEETTGPMSASNEDAEAASTTGKGKSQKWLIAILVGVTLVALAIFANHVRSK